MGVTLILWMLISLAVGVGRAWGQDVLIVFITVADVHRLLDRSTEVVFVDVRGEQEYLARHIKGAISMPLRTLAERYQEIPQERLTVLY